MTTQTEIEYQCAAYTMMPTISILRVTYRLTQTLPTLPIALLSPAPIAAAISENGSDPVPGTL